MYFLYVFLFLNLSHVSVVCVGYVLARKKSIGKNLKIYCVRVYLSVIEFERDKFLFIIRRIVIHIMMFDEIMIMVGILLKVKNWIGIDIRSHRKFI